MRTAEDIHTLFLDRQKARGQILNRMQRVRDQYNGDIAIPIPEMDREGGLFVANLLQQGLDHYGSRISSVLPNVDAPPIDPRHQTSRDRADTRRRAVLSWWEMSNMSLQMRRRARWLVGYGSAPAVIRPKFTDPADPTAGYPCWEPRDPLTCYPAPAINPDELRPADCIFAVRRPLRWIRKMYPSAATALTDNDTKDDALFTILEYNDDEQIAMIACADPVYFSSQRSKEILLERVPNLTGLSLAVVPGRVTLERQTGQFDGMIGMLQMQAKLMALEVMAVQRGVFPDMYLEQRDPNIPAKIISGPHPGYTGKINEIEGGTVNYRSIQPGFQTNAAMDRLERAARLDAGVASEFGGESNTNIRTGRRGDAIMSAMIDFPVQEAQEVMASALEEENRSAIQVAKAWFGDTRKSIYVKWKGAKGHLDYTPNTDFDSEYTVVSYAMAGTDIQNLTIGIQGRVATGLMAKQTARRIDPWIEDAELENDLVTAEGLETANLQSLQQMAVGGQLPIGDAARITELVVEQNVPLYKAILQAQQEAQERQATIDSQGQPAGALPGSPETQPGLALPGAGAEAGVAIPESPTALGNLDEVFRDLRSTGPRQLAG